MAATESFPEVLARLRAERGISVEDLGLEVRAKIKADEKLAEIRGASLSNLQKQAAGTATNPPSPFLMEMVADVLDVSPMEFAEYRLWAARTVLDETQVGLEKALENLSRLDLALQIAGDAVVGSAAERAARRSQPTPQGHVRAHRRPRRD